VEFTSLPGVYHRVRMMLCAICEYQDPEACESKVQEKREMQGEIQMCYFYVTVTWPASTKWVKTYPLLFLKKTTSHHEIFSCTQVHNA
jgi:hypothetical protein